MAERTTASISASTMKAIFLAIGLLAVSAIAFAEEEKKELTEQGLAVLNKLQALKQQEDDALATVEDEDEKNLISTILDKEEDEADKLEKTEESTRVKRAVRRRGRRNGRASRARAARRRFQRRLRRNQRRAAQKRRAHARRHRKNQRRAARKLRRLQRRG